MPKDLDPEMLARRNAKPAAGKILQPEYGSRHAEAPGLGSSEAVDLGPVRHPITLLLSAFVMLLGAWFALVAEPPFMLVVGAVIMVTSGVIVLRFLH